MCAEQTNKCPWNESLLRTPQNIVLTRQEKVWMEMVGIQAVCPKGKSVLSMGPSKEVIPAQYKTVSFRKEKKQKDRVDYRDLRLAWMSK